MDVPEVEATLLDNARDVICVLDESGRFRYVNEAVRRILGYEPSDLVGEVAFDYIPEADRDGVMQVFAEFVTGRREPIDHVEHRFRAADGSVVWAESRISPELEGSVGGYVVSARDITDRKRAERERRETEVRLEEIAAKANDVLWVFDAGWEEVLFVNDAYEAVWGRSIEDLTADPTDFMAGVHPEDHDRVRAAMEALSAGTPAELEYRVNEAEDYRRWVWVQARPVVEDGEVTRIVGFARDVTDRRERERQFQVLDRVLRHNVRTNLNLVMGHAEQVRAIGGEAVDEHVEKIFAAAADLLETAEKERDVVEVLATGKSPGPVDLAAAVRSAAESIADEYPNATVEWDVPEECSANAIPEIHRAIRELLENAIEHSEAPEPAVRVTVAECDGGDAVALEVADDGPSIPDDEIQVLTGEREITRLRHSSGLGLWLVYWVVRLSDGEISFETGSDPGNVVRLELPRPPAD